MLSQKPIEIENADDLRRRIMKRLNIKPEEPTKNFEVLTLEEIRRRKKRNLDLDSNSGSDDETKSKVKKQKLSLKRKTNVEDLGNIKIKTLAEIRAEKTLKTGEEDKDIPTTCSEVSSTSNSEEFPEKAEATESKWPAKRQARKVSSSTDEIASYKPKLKRAKLNQDVVESTSNEKNTSAIESDNSKEICLEVNEENVKEKETEENSNSNDQKIILKSDDQINSCDKSDDLVFRRDSSKLDDILLLDDEDIEDSSINLKAEEDILKDIDDLLND
ncbi:hypothetical protein ILUMI_22973 [Ignelater luminosus]|uniref:Uncharacterized protein n=1 Tax=Ignelater luminosus TaxID=2038154 RepID=A0A8K0G2D0_IGNLU|nr:hypothetical protein ILUMI_22973 [Ignelater luminosus]